MVNAPCLDYKLLLSTNDNVDLSIDFDRDTKTPERELSNKKNSESKLSL